MSDDSRSGRGEAGSECPAVEDAPDPSDLYDELVELEGLVEAPAARAQVRETMELALDVDRSPVFGRVIRGFDAGDAAEAFLGSLLFGIPMFVESGTAEIGAFVAERPAFLVATHALGLAVVVGVLYVADIQDVRIHRPIFGLVPRRLVGVFAIALATAVVVMTVWGRVDWTTPWLAFGQVSVASVPMVVGAALGDILPGS